MDKFTVEYDKTFRGEVKPGKYEALIILAEVKAFPRSGNGIELGLLIRWDIEQDEQRGVHPDSLHFTSRAMYKPRMVAKALGLPAGSEYSLNEFANTIRFRPIRMVVVEKDDENGFATSRVSYYTKGAQIDSDVLEAHLEGVGVTSEISGHGIKLATERPRQQAQDLIAHCKEKWLELSQYTNEELE
jgi:hypothetical protein